MKEVWILPCSEHRFKNSLLPFPKRFEWCQKVFLKNTRVKIKNFDQDYRGKTYDLLKFLKSKFQNQNLFYYVIGQDNADKIESWYCWENLIRENLFIIFPRKSDIKIKKNWYKQSPHRFISLWKEVEISSTEIKNLIRDNNIEEAKKKLLPIIQNKVIDSYQRNNNL